MPWYYASSEAKPVGPVSAEELHSLRNNGAISPETYVIEYTGQAPADWAWKRYREVFPPAPSLPTIPAAVEPAVPLPPTPAPVTAAPVSTQAHPLFPSAAPVAAATVPPAFHTPTPGAVAPAAAYPHPQKPTNGFCAWGFALGLAGFFTSPLCGLGLFLAIPSLILCISGLVQVTHHKEQTGRGLAVAGMILSILALGVALLFIVHYSFPAFSIHEWSTTEQTPNDSE